MIRNREIEPYIPASESLPEITIKALILGLLLSALLAGANAYLGLKVGMTVSASIPAAVISMGVLKFFRRSNILENNIVQTAASAGESLAAGVIFTMPALILMKYWQDFNYMEITLIAALGGLLGVFFSIPLRRALIIEGKLLFPEGVATAEVLKAGDEGGEGVKEIAIAGLAGAVVKLYQTGFKLVSGSIGGAIPAGKTLFPFGCDFSLALLSVGYIVGLNIAILVFVGGLISWLVGIPIYVWFHGLPEGAHGYEGAATVWSTKIRYMGVGAMVVGGIWALVSMIKPLVLGIRSSIKAHSKETDAASVLRTDKDTPFNWVVIGSLLMIIPLGLVYYNIIDREGLNVSSGLFISIIVCALLMAVVAGFLFSAVAGYMAGLVGSSNNPISGITIATILTTSLILFLLLGSSIESASQGVAAAATAILVGGVVCCAAAISGDNLQDLKSGHLVGATPWKQQVMQIVGVLGAAVVIAPVLSLLYNAYGMGDSFPREGMDPGEALAAPQATLMYSVATGVFDRNLEWGMISIGAVIAVVIILLDLFLKARGTTFRTPVLAVAVGIYLPLELSVPIFFGGMIAMLSQRALAKHGPEAMAKGSRIGLLLASGLIAGEAIMGILLAIPFAVFQRTDVLQISGAEGLGLLVLGAFIVWIYRKVVHSASA